MPGCGDERFVAKPIEPEKLLQTLQRWVGNIITTAATVDKPGAEPFPELPGFDMKRAQTDRRDFAFMRRLLAYFLRDFSGQSGTKAGDYDWRLGVCGFTGSCHQGFVR